MPIEGEPRISPELETEELEEASRFSHLSDIYSQCKERWESEEGKDKGDLDREFCKEAEKFLDELSDKGVLGLKDYLEEEWRKGLERGMDINEKSYFRDINWPVSSVITARDERARKKVLNEWKEKMEKEKWKMPIKEKETVYPEEIKNGLDKIKTVGTKLPIKSWDIPFWIENIEELLKKEGTEMVDWKHLLLIRAGSAPLSIKENKIFCKLPKRETLHWTLNHSVTAHHYGSWAHCKYLIFAPAEKMVERNGPPLVLNHVDTFWAEKDLNLPSESVIFLRKESKLPNIEALENRVNLIEYQPDFYLKHKLVIDIIEKLGYTILPGGMWADSRIQKALKPLATKYEMGTSHAHIYEDSPHILEEQKRKQAAFLKHLEKPQIK